MENLTPRQAQILKQEALGAGADAALPRDVFYMESDGRCKALLFGTPSQIKYVSGKLKMQPFGLREVGQELEKMLSGTDHQLPAKLQMTGTALSLDHPIIMGILNVTPDSFYDGGRYSDSESAVQYGLKLAEEGADIIDIGGESSRPGAQPVAPEEELKRVIPVIQKLVKHCPTPVSIDTRKAVVAKEALTAGAKFVNDISALRSDPGMCSVVKDYGAAVCLMHMQGEPQNMQKNPSYDDIIVDILDFLRERINFAVNSGIDKGHIVIDPGIGFGKTAEHNVKILRHISELTTLGVPVLIGASRKSMFGHLFGWPPEERLEGSLAVAAWCIEQGVSILRVHDVKETRKVVDTVAQFQSSEK
jgi:dihydropteroate synthase